jgi:hypothetical protein
MVVVSQWMGLWLLCGGLEGAVAVISKEEGVEAVHSIEERIGVRTKTKAITTGKLYSRETYTK